MNFNMRDYVSDDHIESVGEIAKSQSAIIQALSLENSKLRNQLQQKENIIKEVREWAKKYSCQFTNDDGELVVSEISFNIQARPCDLFKILDKVGDNYNVRERGV